jgi:hypothetical protein
LKKALEQHRASTLKFVNIKARATKELIRFIYTNELRDIEGIEIDLIEIAKKFEVAEMAEKCFAKIMENIRNESAVKVLILAHENNIEQMKSEIINFIIKNFKEIRQDENWKQLTRFPEILMEILSRVDIA